MGFVGWAVPVSVCCLVLVCWLVLVPVCCVVLVWCLVVGVRWAW